VESNTQASAVFIIDIRCTYAVPAAPGRINVGHKPPCFRHNSSTGGLRVRCRQIFRLVSSASGYPPSVVG